jgi:hypothetical protein
VYADILYVAVQNVVADDPLTVGRWGTLIRVGELVFCGMIETQ